MARSNTIMSAVRLIILLMISLATMAPFLSGSVFGAGDAMWYRSLMWDAVIQGRENVFPVYVGATAFNFTGHPVLISTLLYQVLIIFDFLTGRLLSINVLINCVMVGYGLLHVGLPYLALKALAPNRLWRCTVLTILFALCPGGLSTLYTHDMYPSFATAPFIPVAFAALAVMVESNYRPVAAVVAALALAIMWMIHAPTGLLMTYWIAIFSLVALLQDGARARSILANLATVGLVFLAASSWYFCSMITTEITTQTPNTIGPPHGFFAGADFVSAAFGSNWARWPGSLLPVDTNQTIFSVQLGYSLFVVWLLVGLFALRRRIGRLVPFLVCLLVMAILVFPVPVATKMLWQTLPHAFEFILAEPYQRLYRFIAATLVVAAVLVPTGKRHQRIWTTIAIVLVCWSGLEAWKLVHYGWKQLLSTEGLERLYRPESNITNIYAFFRMKKGVDDTVSHYDPPLFDHVIDLDTGMVTIGNQETLLNQCRSSADRVAVVSARCDGESCLLSEPGREEILATFTVAPGSRTLFSYYAEFPDRYLPVPSHHFQAGISIYRNNKFYYNQLLYAEGSHGLSVANAGSEVAHYEVRSHMSGQATGPVRLNQICLTPYDPNTLPIRPLTDVGYRVLIAQGHPGQALETRLSYLRGYQATINGLPVEVLASPQQRLMVPLRAGPNEIEVIYRGTPIMRASFVISVLSTLLALAYLLTVRASAFFAQKEN